ncbi:MAG: LysM peptidoglycan-binding domain-containing protein [Treponema sp.]|nr:LysM peptidoglycan-binding domain-containing protein [Treponema sp.]
MHSHAVIRGDTLGAISVKYYGTFSKWKKIIDANPQLASRKTASDGSPLIYPGDVLIIQDDAVESQVVPQTLRSIELSDSEQDVSIIVDGKKFTGFTKYEINLSADSFDSFSFSAPYDLAVKDIKESLMPFAFKTCAVYYLRELLFKGFLLTPDPELQAEATEITLQGYPLCGILNDCTVPPSKYPVEYYNVTIKDIADPVADAYGIKIIFKDGTGDPFSEVAIEPNEKILEFLLKLAQQRKFLFTNDENGSLVFYKLAQQNAFMQFKEGYAPLISISPQFNAQSFYSHITGYTKNEVLAEPLTYTYENKFLIKKGIMRHDTITVDDAETRSELENAVKAHAGRMFADCVKYNLKCDTHLNNEGKLFKKGMSVYVEAPGAMITRQTNFTARNIKLLRDETGKTADLELVLPGSFTEELPEALPWE